MGVLRLLCVGGWGGLTNTVLLADTLQIPLGIVSERNICYKNRQSLCKVTFGVIVNDHNERVKYFYLTAANKTSVTFGKTTSTTTTELS